MDHRPPFVPGRELAQAFYWQAVRPILDRHRPGLPHASGLVGRGSEVQGFDDVTSTDHAWAPRVDLQLADDQVDAMAGSIQALLARELPAEFMGYSTHMQEDRDDPGTLIRRPDART